MRSGTDLHSNRYDFYGFCRGAPACAPKLGQTRGSAPTVASYYLECISHKSWNAKVFCRGDLPVARPKPQTFGRATVGEVE